MNLLDALRLVAMEESPPLPPLNLSMSEDSGDQRSTVDTATTISCDTEGWRSSTPPPHDPPCNEWLCVLDLHQT